MTLFTFPGKIGDALHQWPLVYHWVREQRREIVVGLDTSLTPLIPLFRAQPFVQDVVILYGIGHYMMGGQPWDFGFTEADYEKWGEVHHMGFRAMPNKQLTLFQQNVLEIAADFHTLSCMPSIVPHASSSPNPRKCVIHGTPASLRLWKLLIECEDLIRYCFDDVRIVGSKIDLGTVEASRIEQFDDGGSFLRLAEFISDAALVIGAGSSVVSLAGAMKVPSVRVAEPRISRDIWSNLGPRQWNLDRAPYREAMVDILEVIRGESGKSHRQAHRHEPQDLVHPGLGSQDS